MSLMKRPSLLLPLFAIVGLSLAVGCTERTGGLRVDVNGEEIATMGLPIGDIAFEDGWSIDFQHVYVAVQDFTIDGDGGPFPLEAESTLVDLHEGPRTVWTFPSVPARRFSEVGYRIAPPSASTRLLGSVTAATRDAMQSAGVSLHVLGTASHPTHGSRSIDLALPLTVHAERCESGADGTSGIVVPESGTRVSEMTLHLDHLFLVSARAEESPLRFDAWAAAADDDGVITLEGLATQPLADLRGIDGGALVDADGEPVIYEPPSTGLPEPTLAAFVRAMANTIGHFEGEGHCEYHEGLD